MEIIRSGTSGVDNLSEKGKDSTDSVYSGSKSAITEP